MSNFACQKERKHMLGTLDCIRVVKVITTGFGNEAETHDEPTPVWEGTSVKDLSTRYPRSQVMGADQLGCQSIEDGFIRWSHRFEGLIGGEWVEISDPRSYPVRETAYARAIAAENRRFYPGDYDDEWEDLGDYDEPDMGYDEPDEYPFGYFANEDDLPLHASDNDDPYSPEALAELFRIRPTFMVNGHHHQIADSRDDILDCFICTPPTCRWCPAPISEFAQKWLDGLCPACHEDRLDLDIANQVCRWCHHTLTSEEVKVGLDQCMECLRLEYEDHCDSCGAKLSLEERGAGRTTCEHCLYLEAPAICVNCSYIVAFEAYQEGSELCPRCTFISDHPVKGRLLQARDFAIYAFHSVQLFLFGRVWFYL